MPCAVRGESRALSLLRAAVFLAALAPLSLGAAPDLFLVLAANPPRAVLLDGAQLEPLHELRLRGAPAGAPQFSPEGRYAYIATQDGWIAKFDLRQPRLVAEARAGTEIREAALSADGRVLAVASAEPRALALFDESLQPLRVLPGRNAQNTLASRIASVRVAASRMSFVAALEDANELWEVSYNPRAEDIPAGVIHDFQYREGAFIPGYLNPRRTELDTRPVGFALARDDNEVLVGTREGRGVAVIHLDVRRRIALLDLQSGVRPEDGAGWQRNGSAIFALPHAGAGAVAIVDALNWKPAGTVKLRGPASFVRSHDALRHALVNTGEGTRDVLQVFDKATLEPVATLVPAPGVAVRDVEFDRSGRRMIVGLETPQGTLVAYDTSTWRELKRLFIPGAVGKYSVFNRIKRPYGARP